VAPLLVEALVEVEVEVGAPVYFAPDLSNWAAASMPAF
jgi:hypothetical protein